MTGLTIEQYTLPVYWASFAVNGDDSGITETDRQQFAAFLKVAGLFLADCIDVLDDCRFSWHNDAYTGLGGDVATFVFHRRPR